MSFSKPRSLFSVKFLWLKHQLSATFLLILPPLKHHSDRCPNFCWHYQINFNFRTDERQEKNTRFQLKVSKTISTSEEEKKLSCQSVFFPPMSTAGSSLCASFKSNSWWELRRTQWQQMLLLILLQPGTQWVVGMEVDVQWNADEVR